MPALQRTRHHLCIQGWIVDNPREPADHDLTMPRRTESTLKPMKPAAGDSGPFLTWVVSIRPRLVSGDVWRTSGRPHLEVGSGTFAPYRGTAPLNIGGRPEP